MSRGPDRINAARRHRGSALVAAVLGAMACAFMRPLTRGGAESPRGFKPVVRAGRVHLASHGLIWPGGSGFAPTVPATALRTSFP